MNPITSDDPLFFDLLSNLPRFLPSPSVGSNSSGVSEKKKRGRPKVSQSRRCYNCHTANSVVWRKIPMGETIVMVCNRCGLYHRRHGVLRPPEAGEEDVESSSMISTGDNGNSAQNSIYDAEKQVLKSGCYFEGLIDMSGSLEFQNGNQILQRTVESNDPNVMQHPRGELTDFENSLLSELDELSSMSWDVTHESISSRQEREKQEFNALVSWFAADHQLMKRD